MQIERFSLHSSDGRSGLDGVIVYPEIEQPKAAIQILHGLAEHVDRYIPLMEALAEEGFLCVGKSHIGHGKSAISEDRLSDFGSYHAFNYLIDDEASLAKKLRKNVGKNVPIYLFGHSMGSLIARSLLIHLPKTYQKAVLMGTGNMEPFMNRMTGGLLSVLRLFVPGTSKLGFLNEAGLGKYNKAFKPNRSPVDWLSVNTDNVDRYQADPLCGQPCSLHTFYVLNQIMAEIRNPKNLQEMNKDLPVLFLAGEEDAFGEFSKGVRKVIQLFEEAGMKNVQSKFYPNARHEILHEDCGDEVVQDIIDFFN